MVGRDRSCLRDRAQNWEGQVKLKPNLIVLLEGRPHRVAMVNDCRAFCVPLARKSVTIKPLAGKPVSFTKPESGTSISPNSELPILGFAAGDRIIDMHGERVTTASFLASHHV
jgi:hypothetical protein